MATDEQKLSVEEKELGAVSAGVGEENAARIHPRRAERPLGPLGAPSENEAVSGDNCGCGADEGSTPPAHEAQAADPVGEKPPAATPASGDDATTNRTKGPGAGCTDSMAQLFATACGGEPTGIAAAMANCRRMFGGACHTLVAPAKANEPPTATEAAGSCKKEV